LYDPVCVPVVELSEPSTCRKQRKWESVMRV
jgi:hypothetical protein